MVTFAVAFAGLAVLAHGLMTRRAAGRLAEVASRIAVAVQSQSEHEGGTDPATVERLESLERRFEALAADAQKWYRKSAQERRRVERALSDEGDDDIPAGAEQLRFPQPAETRAPNGRPRLRRPSRSRR